MSKTDYEKHKNKTKKDKSNIEEMKVKLNNKSDYVREISRDQYSSMKCAHCHTLLTKDEAQYYYEHAERCCDGSMCCCRGLPIEPPYCDRCIEDGRLATIGMALEWALENKQGSWIRVADTPTGSFIDGFDIKMLVKLYMNRNKGDLI